MFLPYFIGLLEGDGSIQVNQWKQRILQFRIVIKLKQTPLNYALCATLKQQIGFLNLHVRHGYVLLIQDDQKKLHKLIKLLDTYPFLTQKMHLDYTFFKYCLFTKPSLSEFSFLKENKQLVPGYTPQQWNPQTMQTNKWIDWWMVGFIEAEGCFCVRSNNTLSFSVGQKNDSHLIEFVKHFFKMPNKIQHRQTTNMYVIEGSKRSMLKTVICFFQTHPFLGEKKHSFEKFTHVFFTPK